MNEVPSAFIVVRETGDPAVLVTEVNSIWKKLPKGGILRWDFGFAHSFPSRKAARKAIQRTVSYDAARGGSPGSDFNSDRVSIVRVAPAPLQPSSLP